jgi:hypothetical protein
MAIDTSWLNEPELSPTSPPPADFTNMAVEDAAEQIRLWFLDNFEDPAQSTPYNGREGGYQYIWGGPYEADDIISNLFADVVSEEIIKAAVEAIERDGGLEWAPSQSRIQPPEDDEPEHVTLATPAAHAEMQRRIHTLEQAVKSLSTPSIGHNHPPEPIEDEPLTATDFKALTAAISAIKAQPVEPTASPTEAIEAASTLQRIRKKMLHYLQEKGDVIVTEAAKEAGKWSVRLPLWGMLGDALLHASHAVMEWLQSLHLPF